MSIQNITYNRAQIALRHTETMITKEAHYVLAVARENMATQTAYALRDAKIELPGIPVELQMPMLASGVGVQIRAYGFTIGELVDLWLSVSVTAVRGKSSATCLATRLARHGIKPMPEFDGSQGRWWPIEAAYEALRVETRGNFTRGIERARV